MCARENIKKLVETIVIVVSAQEGCQQNLDVLSTEDNDTTIIDVATGQIIGAIECGKLPHGLAVPATNDILYVSTERDNKLVVVEPVTDEIVKKDPVGDTPNEIGITLYDRSAPVAADEGRLFRRKQSLFSTTATFLTF